MFEISQGEAEREQTSKYIFSIRRLAKPFWWLLKCTLHCMSMPNNNTIYTWLKLNFYTFLKCICDWMHIGSFMLSTKFLYIEQNDKCLKHFFSRFALHYQFKLFLVYTDFHLRLQYAQKEKKNIHWLVKIYTKKIKNVPMFRTTTTTANGMVCCFSFALCSPYGFVHRSYYLLSHHAHTLCSSGESGREKKVRFSIGFLYLSNKKIHSTLFLNVYEILCAVTFFLSTIDGEWREKKKVYICSYIKMSVCIDEWHR